MFSPGTTRIENVSPFLPVYVTVIPTLGSPLTKISEVNIYSVELSASFLGSLKIPVCVPFVTELTLIERSIEAPSACGSALAGVANNEIVSVVA